MRNGFLNEKDRMAAEKEIKMNLIKTPVKGMPEYGPLEAQIRENALNKIKNTYGKYGFLLIETPALEHIENLTSRQGGDNEKLTFKVMKRGAKLEQETDVSRMCDCGLRYDLTVPLARFYANNRNNLPVPFKSLQVGHAWRAERPQKGRFRQFMQCDIDVIGDSSNLAEIELIGATMGMLHELGLGNSTVRINDRRILKAMAASCSFPDDEMDAIFIILDKLDKIGMEGVKTELLAMGLPAENVDRYCCFFTDRLCDSCGEFFEKNGSAAVDRELIQNLDSIIRCVRPILPEGGRIVFDPTLVRGMSYYTGPIFEVGLDSSGLSIAGGGRYDKMIGKFCGEDVPACGFSIGFERIISLMRDQMATDMDENNRLAFLIDRDVDENKIGLVLKKAAALRAEGMSVLVSPRRKNAGKQKSSLEQLGYRKIIDIYKETEI